MLLDCMESHILGYRATPFKTVERSSDSRTPKLPCLLGTHSADGGGIGSANAERPQGIDQTLQRSNIQRQIQ